MGRDINTTSLLFPIYTDIVYNVGNQRGWKGAVDGEPVEQEVIPSYNM